MHKAIESNPQGLNITQANLPLKYLTYKYLEEYSGPVHKIIKPRHTINEQPTFRNISSSSTWTSTNQI
jgi:hypothetical protein